MKFVNVKSGVNVDWLAGGSSGSFLVAYVL